MYTLGSSFLALQVQDVAPLAGSGGILEIVRETGPLNQAVLAILILFSIVSWAIILFKTLSYRTRRASDRDVPRRLPPQPEVLRSAGRLPVAAAESAGRRVPGGYAEINAQFRLTESDPVQSGRRAGTSNAQEPRRPWTAR